MDGERFEAAHVVHVFVGNNQCVDLVRRLAHGRKPVINALFAEARIHQQAGSIRRDQGAIALAPAA